MDLNRPDVKRELDRELAGLRFGNRQNVLERTHPNSLPGRLRAWWNKELELPVVPIGAALLLLLTAAFLYRAALYPKGPLPGSETAFKRELVEEAGSVYWKDDLERRLALLENPGQN
ncbi:hypothetical protein [Paenibacillus cookii]|uniref:Nudix hydrolase domain-containing protein n=1 Tax=Paenibacillus cookii TaxID=157839 RepID=A0ABQ4M3Z8_9BACL|nr:hypothetical protein [Paenibacillus cookii]GIO70260.1 hypothetical protein J21TS3_50810 [Paenibacillus cookii]